MTGLVYNKSISFIDDNLVRLTTEVMWDVDTHRFDTDPDQDQIKKEKLDNTLIIKSVFQLNKE